VVGMGMRRHHDVDGRHALAPHVGDEFCPFDRPAAVDEHTPVVRLDENGVALAHVDKVHLDRPGFCQPALSVKKGKIADGDYGEAKMTPSAISPPFILRPYSDKQSHHYTSQF